MNSVHQVLRRFPELLVYRLRLAWRFGKNFLRTGGGIFPSPLCLSLA